jgi:membrane associated rhomboid family serine protease
MVNLVAELTPVAPNANLVGTATPTLKMAYAKQLSGTEQTAQMPKRPHTNSVNFPPPQLPSQSPTPPPPPPAITRKPVQRNSYKPNNNPFVVSNAIIAINLGLFVWSQISGVGRFQYNMSLSRVFLDNGEWYRLISAGFVHFGLLHVAMNMFLLFQLGRMLEPTIGSTKFALIYCASLLGGSAGALVLSPFAFTGGASGAVFGIMAAGVVGMREHGVNPLKTGLGMTFAINIVLTVAIPGISIGGHFGGALAGALCGFVILAPTRFKIPEFFQYATPILVGVAAIFISLA